jgi:hypothetical protein
MRQPRVSRSPTHLSISSSRTPPSSTWNHLIGFSRKSRACCDPVADSSLPFPRLRLTISWSGAGFCTRPDSTSWRNDIGRPWIADCYTGTFLPLNSGAIRSLCMASRRWRCCRISRRAPLPSGSFSRTRPEVWHGSSPAACTREKSSARPGCFTAAAPSPEQSRPSCSSRRWLSLPLVDARKPVRCTSRPGVPEMCRGRPWSAPDKAQIEAEPRGTAHCGARGAEINSRLLAQRRPYGNGDARRLKP